MGAKRLGPEAKIISLFNALPDESKRIVLDIIKSQSVRAPKSTAPAAGKKSKQKSGEQGSTQSIEVKADDASSVPSGAKPVLCWSCGHEAEYMDHFQPSPNYHKFVRLNKGKKEKAPLLPDVPEEFVHGVGA